MAHGHMSWSVQSEHFIPFESGVDSGMQSKAAMQPASAVDHPRPFAWEPFFPLDLNL